MAGKLFVPGKREALARAGIQVNDQCQFREVISKQWICDRCNLFCKELVPVLRPGQRLARFPLINRVRCVNGCNERPGWGFHPFSSLYYSRIKEWPGQRKR